MRHIFTFTVILLFFSSAVQAGEVVSAGKPADVALDTDPGFVFEDIYTRQVLYKDKRDKLSRLIEERSENFVKPRYRAYHDHLEATGRAKTTKENTSPIGLLPSAQ